MTNSKAAPQLVPYQFQPGQSGNPGGKYNLPADILEARKYSNIEVERLIHQLLEKSHDQVEDILFSPVATTLEKLLASMMCVAIKRGDHQRIEWIFNRAGIKAAESQSEFLGKLLMAMPKEELVALGQRAMTRLTESSKGSIDVNSKAGAPDGKHPERDRK